MRVGSRSDTGFQQGVVFINGHQRVDHECDETQVVFPVLSRREEVDARIGSHRPVAVLTRTVHTHKRLFVEQHAEVVAAGNTFHHRHQQLVMVVGEVAFLVNRR